MTASRREKRRQYYKLWRQKNKNKVKAYCEKIQDKHKESSQIWRDNNLTKVVEYRKRNRSRINAQTAKYRAEMLKRFPKWLTKKELEDIKEFYKNCPEGYEVDHIIPLQGKNISGLHVLSNLQYLTKSENSGKCNRWEL